MRTLLCGLALAAASCALAGAVAPAAPAPGADAAKAAALLARQLDEAAEGSCPEADEEFAEIEKQLDALVQQCPPNAPGRKELEQVKAKLPAARAAIAKRRTELGQCVLQIGGKALDPKTHAIVVPDPSPAPGARPTPQERFAARDLNAHIERLTGKALPIVADSKLGSQIPIVVGKCTAALEKLGIQINFDLLGLEGVELRSKGPALVLAGNKRGALYAVYTFLEDYCGCRWFTPDCTVVPKTGTLKIDDLNYRHIPPLEYRSTDYPCSRDADWAVRNKMNGTQTRLDERRGGKIEYSHFVHTFNSILNPAQHFATHPEYFSMINGKRVGGNTQLCLTNPEVLEIAKKTVRRWIEEAPAATIFSVSQNDWHNCCQCPTCKALAEQEGTEAGPVIHFVNAIGRDIAKDYPDKLISTLAYQYTRTPPKHVRPEPNVCVRLCTIECDFAHPLDKSTHPQNQKFVKDIEGWHEKCNRLYIWDYIIDYGHSVMPWPNLYALRPNIEFFIRSGVRGVYEEACYFTKGSELAELRTWIIAKSMWNPSVDTDRAIDEFLAGYYGPAAPLLRKYINLMHKPVLDDPNLHIFIWTAPNAPYLNDKAIADSVALFDEAEKAVAADPVLLHRVQVARLPILYVQLVGSKQGYKEEGDNLVDTATPDEADLAKRFETIARKEGLTTIRENRSSGELGTWLKSLNFAGKKIPIVRLGNDALDLAILPSLGGRIWKMVYKPAGRDILKRYLDKDGGALPDAGGYEEYSEGEYRSPGWREAYRVAAKTNTSVTLEAKLPNQLVLKRTIGIDPQKPLVVIESTLTNVGKEPRKACLRAHPGYAVPDVAKAAVATRRADGKWESKPLALPQGTPEKDEWLTGNDLPDGQWMIIDTAADLGIRSAFDKALVSQCLLNRSAADGRVNLELYSQQATLAPGQSVALKHTIEVVPKPGPEMTK